MNAEKALKGALIGSIICPEYLVDRFVETAARAAAHVDDETISRVQREIEAMTEWELFDFIEGVAGNG